MLLRKYMSLLGIGSAKVDLILEKEEFGPQETVNGKILIKGGTVDQQLKRIEVDLVSAENLGSQMNEEVIHSVTILTSKLISAECQEEYPFTFSLPAYLSETTRNKKYRFKTRLFFHEGVKSVDQDEIEILA